MCYMLIYFALLKIILRVKEVKRVYQPSGCTSTRFPRRPDGIRVSRDEECDVANDWTHQRRVVILNGFLSVRRIQWRYKGGS